MNASPAIALSIEYLSWINQQLRERVAAQEQAQRESRFAVRIKAVVVAGLSGISAAVWKLL